MRDPCTGLREELLSRQSEWAGAGIKDIRCVGDAYAPGAVAAAVYSEHCAAREFDAAPTPLDSVPFRRERIAIERRT